MQTTFRGNNIDKLVARYYQLLDNDSDLHFRISTYVLRLHALEIYLDCSIIISVRKTSAVFHSFKKSLEPKQTNPYNLN